MSPWLIRCFGSLPPPSISFHFVSRMNPHFVRPEQSDVRLHAEGIHSLDAGERFPRPLGPDPVAALMASEAIGHVILEDFLHREQQRLVHVLAGERRQARD